MQAQNPLATSLLCVVAVGLFLTARGSQFAGDERGGISRRNADLASLPAVTGPRKAAAIMSMSRAA